MINIERKDKIDIISFPVDKIDALITDEIRELINKVFENSFSKVVINLHGVEYIDSSGFSCFLSILSLVSWNYFRHFIFILSLKYTMTLNRV